MTGTDWFDNIAKKLGVASSYLKNLLKNTFEEAVNRYIDRVPEIISQLPAEERNPDAIINKLLNVNVEKEYSKDGIRKKFFIGGEVSWVKR